MNVFIKHIDILDEQADALIYSTNVLLNCSGGVGAGLVLRYGKEIQDRLHCYLENPGSTFVDQGFVLEDEGGGTPYKKIFHTVPCDGFYETDEVIMEKILRQVFSRCDNATDIRKVTISVLATGYGKLSYESFFSIFSKVTSELKCEFLNQIVICIEDDYLFRLAQDYTASDSKIKVLN